MLASLFLTFLCTQTSLYGKSRTYAYSFASLWHFLFYVHSSLSIPRSCFSLSLSFSVFPLFLSLPYSPALTLTLSFFLSFFLSLFPSPSRAAVSTTLRGNAATKGEWSGCTTRFTPLHPRSFTFDPTEFSHRAAPSHPRQSSNDSFHSQVFPHDLEFILPSSRSSRSSFLRQRGTLIDDSRFVSVQIWLQGSRAEESL